MSAPRTAARAPWVEVLLPAAYAAVFTALGPARSAPWPCYALIAVQVACLVLYRRWAGPAFAVSTSASLVGLVAGWSSDPCVASAWILYSWVSRRPAHTWTLRASWVAVVLAAFVPLAMGVETAGPAEAPSSGLSPGLLLACLPVLAVAWAAGTTTADRRRTLARATGRVVAAAVADERLRIARDIHDVVSHSLSAIGVQAAVAARVDPDRETLRATLESIGVQAGRSMDDMRSMLTALRGGPRDAPGLEDLPFLVEAVGRLGTETHLDLDVHRPLAPDRGRVAYRIVQEALTNAVRHAPGSTCRVRVADDGADLVVEVADDGPGARGDPGHGHGLVGMRERVLGLGGSLEAGDREGRAGFAVRAVLPMGPEG